MADEKPTPAGPDIVVTMSELKDALTKRLAEVETLALETVGAERKARFAYALALLHVSAFLSSGTWSRLPDEPHLRLV